MPQRAKDTFVFPKELGARLRQLRLRASLTQVELAQMMGRSGRSFRPELGQLECGRIRYPSLAVVADYLRACRASFSDIADILDRYTSQPRAAERQARLAVMEFVETLPAKVEKAVDAYDIKTAVKRRDRVKTDEQMCREAWLEKLREHDQAWENAVAQVTKEAEPMMAEAGVLKGYWVFFRGLVRQCMMLAQETRPESEERSRRVKALLDRLAEKGREKELGRRIAEHALARFDELKETLPPDPRPK